MHPVPQGIFHVIFLMWLVVLLQSTCAAGRRVSADKPPVNANSSLPLERTKRFISFPTNGGVAKVLFGFLAPVRFMHPLPRVLNLGINLQANYVISPNIIFPHPESIFQNRALEGYTDRKSRARLYRLLEKSLRVVTGAGRRARECLLRTVCEVADTPLSHNGLVGELLDVVLTPQETDILSPEFLLARKYGANGVDCARVFSDCPWGLGLLDYISSTTL